MMKNGLILFFFAISVLLRAQTWRPLPMYGGGFITDLVLHPSDANTIIGVCDVGGLFISTDDCQTWASHTANVPKTDARNFHVRSFAFDPITPTTQYFVSGDSPYSSVSKIWKTTNNATVWNYTSLPINISGNESARYAGTVLIINPLNTNTLYIGGQPSFNYTTSVFNTDGGLMTSTNGGSNWAKIGGNTFDQTWITKLRFAPNDPNLIYISAISKTMNGGSTVGAGLWRYNATTTTLTQLTTTPILDFDFDAISTNTIITTASNANLISTDAGATWANLTTPAGLTYGLFVTAHPTQSNVWYFGTFNFTQNTIVTTNDGGIMWQQVKYSATHNNSKMVYPAYLNNNQQPSFGNYMACLLIRGGNAYLSDWYGVWRTPDAGSDLANSAAAATNNSNWTWTFQANGIHNMVQVRTSLHPTDENRFYCNVADLHYYESTDAGATMKYTTTAPMNMTCRIDFHQNNPQIGFMCGTKEHGDIGKIYKTTDAGVNWFEIAASIFNAGAKNITDLQLTPAVGTVIVGIEKNSLPNQIYRSDDGGSTWTAWDDGLTTANVFKTWDKVDRLLKDADGETFYVWRNNTLFRRKLTDAAWTQLTLPLAIDWLSGVYTHRTNAQTIYMSQYNTAVYKSTNGGTTWTALSPLLNGATVGTFAVSKNGSIAVQSWKNSVQALQFSSNDGATWSTLASDGFLRMIEGLTFLNDTKLIGWTGGNSAFMATIATSVLPLELIDFQGVAMPSGNQIYWRLADLKELNQVEIQKSEAGQPFTTVGILGRKESFWKDSNPFEVTYYRLKMTDIQNNISYSKIISIYNQYFSFKDKIKLYPNPVQDLLHVDWGAKDGSKMEIVNQFGQRVQGWLANECAINLLGLPNGVYFLKAGGQMIRFVKL